MLLNFSAEAASVSLPQLARAGEVWISNYLDLALSDDEMTLAPYQAVIVAL